MLKLNLAIYQKLFVSASSVFIIFVLCIFILISSSYFEVQITNEQQLNEKKVAEVIENIQYDLLAIDNTMYSLYENPQTLTDTINYLALDREQYYNFRLSSVSKQVTWYYQGHEKFVQNIFNRNQRVIGVGLYSYHQDSLTTFKPYGGSVIINQVLKQQADQQLATMIKRRFDFAEQYALPIAYPIKKSDEIIGEIVIFQNLNFIDEILQRYQQENRALQIVWQEKLIYDSTKTHAYLTPMPMPPDKASWETRKLVINNQELTVSAERPTKNFLAYMGTAYWSISVVVVVGLFLGVYCIWRRMKQAEERLESVLIGISEIEAGNLETVITVRGENNDELTIIANRLNAMSKEIKQRISEQYLTAINQQKAELAFLQSQINPHFLYNTLETIRMKAIVEGNREVGQLIFGLATLFRQTYQKSRIITIAEEIELIDIYLQLFMNRYPELFTYHIQCEPQLKTATIVKFILQPIIENYFVHGIDYTQNMNLLTIEITTLGEKIQIVISDNGSGMSCEQIAALNDKLASAKIYQLEQSIALVNINKRLELTYGADYRFEFYQNATGGLSIRLVIPNLVEEKGEADV
ncbi:MAG: sensor histidine kinase [Culicoidibacterales bacterium]